MSADQEAARDGEYSPDRQWVQVRMHYSTYEDLQRAKERVQGWCRNPATRPDDLPEWVQSPVTNSMIIGLLIHEYRRLRVLVGQQVQSKKGGKNGK